MKKILCIALLAFGYGASAQTSDAVNYINNNQIIKTAYESDTLTFKEKVAVINEQVSQDAITDSQAFQIISLIMAQEQAEGTVETTEENYDYDWGKETSPFDYAMGVQLDTVVKYKTQIIPYLAVGVGNVAIDGAFANSEFGYLRSNYVEFGVAARTPFSKANNKWGVRYGLGIKYNGLATTENRLFGFRGGNQTVTMSSPIKLRKNYAYLRNTYINIPISLDFTTTTKSYNEANRRFTTIAGMNFGIGGYLGYNINSKQHLRYDVGDYKNYEQQKGDWNVNNFQYGLMAYAGTDNLKVVFKYDLNPVFSNNTVDQNYWSIGIQFGL